MPKHYKKNVAIALIVIFLIVLLNYFVFTDFLQNGVYALFKKIGGSLNKYLFKASSISRLFINFSTVIKDNQKLSEENKKLIFLEAQIDKFKKDNELLREQLKLNPKNNYQLVEAKIFSINRNQLNSTILIDKGEKDGIKKNMSVILSGDILLGSVYEVYEKSALVLLLDDPRSITSVKLITDSGQQVIGSGRGGNSIVGTIGIDLVTNIEQVKEGNLVVTSGLDNYPESLVVGKVNQSQLKGGNLFKIIQAKLSFDPIQNPLVFIILE